MTRNMKVTKPAFAEMKAAAACRSKVVTLFKKQNEEGSHDLWQASNFHRMREFDPIDLDSAVLHSFQVLEVIESFPRLVLKLGPDVEAVLEALRKPVDCIAPKAKAKMAPKAKAKAKQIMLDAYSAAHVTSCKAASQVC